MAQEYEFIYTLNDPVNYGEKEVKKIAYRNPVGRDMHGIVVKDGGFTMGEFIKFFAKISDQAPPFYDCISPRDYMGIISLASDFLGGGPATG